MWIYWHFFLYYPGKPKEVFFRIEKELEGFFSERAKELVETEEMGARAYQETDRSWYVGADGDYCYEPHVSTIDALLQFVAEHYPDSVSVAHWEDEDTDAAAIYFLNDGKWKETGTDGESFITEANKLLEKGNAGKFAFLDLLGCVHDNRSDFRYVGDLGALDFWDTLDDIWDQDHYIHRGELERIVRKYWGLEKMSNQCLTNLP